MCWPPTPPRTMAVLKCFDEFHGLKYEGTQNASRFCAEGTWENYTDYTRCMQGGTATSNVTATADVTSLLYLGGYSLSLAALALAVFVFVYFKDLRCLRNTIHTNLMCTYILSACIWILNLVLQLSAQADQMSCMVLVVCLHYFYLTNFFWMLVEGLYLYMLVVETFTAENIKLKVYATIGWGAPAVVITAWIITRCLVTVEKYTEPDELGWLIRKSESSKYTTYLRGAEPVFSSLTQLAGYTELDGEYNCRHAVPGYVQLGSLASEAPMCPWVREHSVDWIHKAPAMAGLALNLFFLVRIMWVLITKLRSANTLETEQYRKATKALLVLIPLLGITYILVLCGPSDGWISVVFDYTRAILLSTQGFTVALFYCFLNTEVRHAIRYHVERWKNGRAVAGGRRRGASYSKDWSPRSRTESIRLYSHPNYGKRESAVSETTTTTLLARNSLAPPLQDSRHLHVNDSASPSVSGDQSPV